MERQRQHVAFLAHLQKWPSERLFTAERQVRELMDHPGWGELTGLIDAARESAETRMKYGPIREQADYARDLGMIAGLEALKAASEAVFLRADEVQARLQAREAQEA